MQILPDFARVHIVLRIAKNSGVSNIYSTIFSTTLRWSVACEILHKYRTVNSHTHTHTHTQTHTHPQTDRTDYNTLRCS